MKCTQGFSIPGAWSDPYIIYNKWKETFILTPHTSKKEESLFVKIFYSTNEFAKA